MTKTRSVTSVRINAAKNKFGPWLILYPEVVDAELCRASKAGRYNGSFDEIFEKCKSGSVRLPIGSETVAMIIVFGANEGGWNHCKRMIMMKIIARERTRILTNRATSWYSFLASRMIIRMMNIKNEMIREMMTLVGSSLNRQENVSVEWKSEWHSNRLATLIHQADNEPPTMIRTSEMITKQARTIRWRYRRPMVGIQRKIDMKNEVRERERYYGMYVRGDLFFFWNEKEKRNMC